MSEVPGCVCKCQAATPYVLAIGKAKVIIYRLQANNCFDSRHYKQLRSSGDLGGFPAVGRTSVYETVTSCETNRAQRFMKFDRQTQSLWKMWTPSSAALSLFGEKSCKVTDTHSKQQQSGSGVRNRCFRKLRKLRELK